MPGVTVQFHMLFDELVVFVSDMMRHHSLAVELERFFPTTTRVVTTSVDLSDEITRFGHVDRMWLLCKPPRARKYERFNLNVGRQKDNRLEQSHLGAGTDKAEALKTLKKIAYQLKKRTIAGVWVIGVMGHVGFTKIFEYRPVPQMRHSQANWNSRELVAYSHFGLIPRMMRTSPLLLDKVEGEQSVALDQAGITASEHHVPYSRPGK